MNVTWMLKGLVSNSEMGQGGGWGGRIGWLQFFLGLRVQEGLQHCVLLLKKVPFALPAAGSDPALPTRRKAQAGGASGMDSLVGLTSLSLPLLFIFLACSNVQFQWWLFAEWSVFS